MKPVGGPSSSGGGLDGEVSSSTPAADDPVAQRFRQMMGESLPQEDGAATAADGVQREAVAPTSLGDAILSALSNATDGVSASWAELQHGLELPKAGTSIDPGALLVYTERMRIWGIQTEIVSKGVSKATQDLDQLLKPQ